MRRRLAVAVIAALGILGSLSGPVVQADPAVGQLAAVEATASHYCSSGYTHAITPGGHKCLRAGQYCSHKPGYANAYRKAGYRCKANGRLVRR